MLQPGVILNTIFFFLINIDLRVGLIYIFNITLLSNSHNPKKRMRRKKKKKKEGPLASDFIQYFPFSFLIKWKYFLSHTFERKGNVNLIHFSN
jgi:hypothetical protein